MATIPPNATDGRALGYQFYNIHVPIDMVASLNADGSNNGYLQSSAVYFGGRPYQGEDSGSYGVIPVTGRLNHAYQLISSQLTSYSVKAQGSLDGTNWTDIGTAHTTDSYQSFTGLYKFIRFNVTAIVLAGSPDPTLPQGLKIIFLSVAD